MCLISHLTTAPAALCLSEQPRNLFHYKRVSDANSLWVWNFVATHLAEVPKANLNLGFETQLETFKILYAVLFIS